MHRVVKMALRELEVGEIVSYKGIRAAVLRGMAQKPTIDGPDECYHGRVIEVYEEDFQVEVYCVEHRENNHILVPWSKYLCSHAHSPDSENRDWTECEQHYGIDHEGSETKCPLRQLAFAILRGDPMALDAARDILKV